MTNSNLVLWELPKITKELTKTKDELTFSFRMTKTNEVFPFNSPIVNPSKLILLDYLFLIRC